MEKFDESDDYGIRIEIKPLNVKKTFASYIDKKDTLLLIDGYIYKYCTSISMNNGVDVDVKKLIWSYIGKRESIQIFRAGYDLQFWSYVRHGGHLFKEDYSEVSFFMVFDNDFSEVVHVKHRQKGHGRGNDFFGRIYVDY